MATWKDAHDTLAGKLAEAEKKLNIATDALRRLLAYENGADDLFYAREILAKIQAGK